LNQYNQAIFIKHIVLNYNKRFKVSITIQDKAMLAASEHLLTLIKALLVSNPSKQPTVTEVLAKYSQLGPDMPSASA
jgi:hypothetical protein